MTKTPYGSFCNELGCTNIQDLCDRAARCNRKISDDQHLIRSCILELHAVVEVMLKHVLFHHMLLLIENIEEYHEENEPQIKALAETIKRFSCGTVLQLLYPCLKAWGSSVMDPLPEINQVRNLVAHRKLENVQYKGRNPFTDPDAFAEFIHDTEIVLSELGEFCVQKFGFAHPKTIERMDR